MIHTTTDPMSLQAVQDSLDHLLNELGDDEVITHLVVGTEFQCDKEVMLHLEDIAGGAGIELAFHDDLSSTGIGFMLSSDEVETQPVTQDSDYEPATPDPLPAPSVDFPRANHSAAEKQGKMYQVGWKTDMSDKSGMNGCKAKDWFIALDGAFGKYLEKHGVYPRFISVSQLLPSGVAETLFGRNGFDEHAIRGMYGNLPHLISVINRGELMRLEYDVMTNHLFLPDPKPAPALVSA